jgi:hypothetical protein
VLLGDEGNANRYVGPRALKIMPNSARRVDHRTEILPHLSRLEMAFEYRGTTPDINCAYGSKGGHR